ncbi:MAG: hypothetical protein KAH72_09620, partial [Flavobacteriaceae bacterium]|nr:hypothetical protein [Flavobacteriaceae bacterium]
MGNYYKYTNRELFKITQNKLREGIIMFYIDTRCDIRYASFYIQGLYEVFGKSQVKFSNKYTSEVSLDEYVDIVDRLLLIVETDNSGKVIKKVVID